MIACIVAEDEELTRRRLVSMIMSAGDFCVVAEASDGSEALAAIAARKPDVVFLDIEMPGCGGFEVVQNATVPFRPVFVTAYDQYAVRAFEANAVDYLLKPVSSERLQKTLEKLRAEVASPHPSEIANLRRLLGMLASGGPRHVAAQRGKRIILVPVPTIVWAAVEDELVFLHTTHERLLTDHTLNELEQLLSGCGFFRISRSQMVNLDHVRELIPWSSGTYKLVTSTRAELSVSRERGRRLRAAIGL